MLTIPHITSEPFSEERRLDHFSMDSYDSAGERPHTGRGREGGGWSLSSDPRCWRGPLGLRGCPGRPQTLRYRLVDVRCPRPRPGSRWPGVAGGSSGPSFHPWLKGPAPPALEARDSGLLGHAVRLLPRVWQRGGGPHMLPPISGGVGARVQGQHRCPFLGPWLCCRFCVCCPLLGSCPGSRQNVLADGWSWGQSVSLPQAWQSGTSSYGFRPSVRMGSWRPACQVLGSCGCPTMCPLPLVTVCGHRAESVLESGRGMSSLGARWAAQSLGTGLQGVRLPMASSHTVRMWLWPCHATGEQNAGRGPQAGRGGGQFRA